jgi:hypothetical protein
MLRSPMEAPINTGTTISEINQISEWHVDKNLLFKALTNLKAEDPESTSSDNHTIKVVEELINDQHFPDYFNAVQAKLEFEERNPDFYKRFNGSKDSFDNITPRNLRNKKFLELLDIDRAIMEAKVKLLHEIELPTISKLNISWTLPLARAYAVEAKILF